MTKVTYIQHSDGKISLADVLAIAILGTKKWANLQKKCLTAT